MPTQKEEYAVWRRLHVAVGTTQEPFTSLYVVPVVAYPDQLLLVLFVRP